MGGTHPVPPTATHAAAWGDEQGGALAPPNPQQLLGRGGSRGLREGRDKARPTSIPWWNPHSGAAVTSCIPPSLQSRPSSLSPPGQQDEVGMCS